MVTSIEHKLVSKPIPKSHYWVWILGAVFLVFSGLVQAKHQLTIGGYYFTGDYGLEEETVFTFIPLIYSYRSKPWKFTLSTGWISVDGPGDINNDTSGLVGRGRLTRENGLADIWFKATYQKQRPLPGQVWMDLSAAYKIPTADEDKGLGTGESDQKLKLDFFKQISSYFFITSLGYKKRGNPAGSFLTDSRGVSVGVSRNLGNGSSWGVFYDLETPSSEEKDNRKELSAFRMWQPKPLYTLGFYLVTGLSDNSVDYGTGLQIKWLMR